MMSRFELIAIAIATVIITAFAVALSVDAKDQGKSPAVYTGIVKGVAVGGYDPVAYFSESRAVTGKADITLEHQGATWRFASAANRDQFKADPAKYAPQYGGHCAWAVSQGYVAKGDPSAWTIVDGKLYLNYNKSVQKSWEPGARANIAKGDVNWPKLVRAPQT